ncbi:hypothetical protein M422DRAFT_29678 [Sphaerobolus stellatus SS14]|uniref:DinB-like domain-containing protein n=1 Tax=Sphaerobolus stellatus (strain SS14) TaxID=990650 RepID=A0A0C9W378_SPHS4|nr:hypothetical protein M422DRAFT_29678 [Sphaerobolus stellatus SS14]
MPSNEAASPDSILTSQPTGLSALFHVSRMVLLQARDLIFNNIVADEQLTYKSKLMPGSTIGKHMRHARDHFELLLDSLHAGPPYILSYDKRIRNTPMESSLQGAYDALTATVTRLDELLDVCREDEEHGKGFVTVDGHSIGLDEIMTLNAVTPHMQALQTSFGRELWFSALHAIHHWSMVRVVAGELDIQIDGEFGVAPSTTLYRKTSETPSKSKM